MGMTDIQMLNAQFGLANQLSFKTGPGNLPVAEINNGHATATISLYGGHVIAFRPHEHEPVIWASKHSFYEEGKAIRGGIPVCWPWFAGHPTDAGKPAHGFVRTMMWAVRGTGLMDNGATQIQLGLSDSKTSRALWPHAFQLQLTITVGAELQVELLARNSGDEPFVYSGALHSYFGVSDISQVVIHGLDGCDYLDKVDAFRRKTQQGPVTITAETDRIYLETTAECVIEDEGWQRRLHIAKTGSRTTVVWNPWAGRARQLPDMGDKEYTRLVCVETANAAEDVITIAPGGEHRLKMVVSSQLV
jgi:D-hexose-6-phosphate mutarotase